MKSPRQAQKRERELDPVWRALSNPMRRRMLDLLRKGPLNTRELTVQFPGYSRFAVMQHLTVLAAGRLVVRRRQGRERLNYLNPVPIQQIHQRWVSRYEGPWMEALIALKEEAEAGDRGARKQRAQAA